MNERMDAGRIADEIQALVDQLRPAVVSEVRHYLAEALVSVSECGTHELDESGPGGKLPSFDDEDSFLAGVAYAAQLVADESFDF